MAIEYNSHLRAGRQITNAELTQALGLDPRSSPESLGSELLTVQAKAEARLNTGGSCFIAQAENSLRRTWENIRGNFVVPETGLLFGPTFEMRRGSDLESLRELAQLLAPLTEITPESAKQIFKLDDLIQDRRLKGPSAGRKQLWDSCIYQARRVLEGGRGFLSQAEAEVLTTLSRRPVAPHVEQGARLGRTNLVWRSIDGRWEPCFENGRYRTTSILLASRRYLQECLETHRLPNDSIAAEQQRAILSRALRAINNSYGDESRRRVLREELRYALLRDFPPRG